LENRNSEAGRIEKIWTEYSAGLYFFSKQLTGSIHEECEDIVQKAFVRFLDHSAGYANSRKARTLLYTIVRNLCLDFLRKRKRWDRITMPDPAGGASAETEQAIESVADTCGTVETDLLRKEKITGIRKAVDSLHPENKALVYLRFHEELTYREIARILGKPAGTLKYRFHELKKQLHALLEDYYET
jgi:RNA polymerase sigma-70 factor, ECF subfamily